MIEVKEEQERKVKCFLVGLPPKKDEEGYPKELDGLVTTLGMEIAGVLVLNRLEVAPVYGMGKGKAFEIADKAKECFAECIIFDWELDPSKQRNWERLTNIPCFDRNEVILRIFAQRAETKEAVLQVELAKLTYSLPRLSHSYGDMSRQRGGSYGAKGSGETQLELDRRQVEDKIIQIKKEIETVALNRSTQRRQRERTASSTCALVGYTNAGKSSLLNSLTGAEVFVKDELFATLDPTTRRLTLPEGTSILMTDTVGFISNLPHLLIDAFKSTLEEAALSQLLLIVVDASDPDYLKQYNAVQKVLQEINADKVPQQIVLNKFDRIKDDIILLTALKSQFPNAIYVSAKTQEGFEFLINAIKDKLLGHNLKYIIPSHRNDLVNLARKNGTIISEEWLEDGVHLEAQIPPDSRTLALLSEYLVN